MKHLLQSVSFVLILLMLAPPAFAAMQCGAEKQQATCTKSCCEGMEGMVMPMSENSLQSAPAVQVSQAPCCQVAPTDTTLPATTVLGAEVVVVPLSSTFGALLTEVSAGQLSAFEYPPGTVARASAPALLCTFRI